MPTRVVIRDTPSNARSNTAARRGRSGLGLESEAHNRQRRSFRSSIVRHVHKQGSSKSQSRHSSNNGPKKPAGISSTDIRASPRLLGYLYTLIASSVMLASVVQLYQNGEEKVTGIFRSLKEEEANNKNNINDVVTVLGNDLLRWKLDGALVVSIVGGVVSFGLFAVHFDTVLAPRLWKKIFHDGSLIERNILIFMMLFWAAALYICTSSLSVGATQANVYFTTWIAFGSSLMNYDIWRSGAKLPTFGEINFKRETTSNWIWVLVTELVYSFAVLDMYLHRDYLEFLIDGVLQGVPHHIWMQALGISFGFTGGCLVVLAGIWLIPDHWTFRLLWIDLSFRHVELVVVLGMVGTGAWGSFSYTGVNKAMHQPGNAYFGIWASLLSAIVTLGTWLRENRALLPSFYLDDEDDEGEAEEEEPDHFSDEREPPREGRNEI